MRPWTSLPLTLLLASLPLVAQGGPQGPRRKPGPEPAGVMAHILKVRMERLQSGLNLSEDKARGIAESWNRRDTGLMERGRELNEVRRRAQDILQGTGSDAEKDPRIRPLLDRIRTLRQQQIDTRQRFEDEIRASLTPCQQARFIFLMEDLDRHVREGMREAMRGGRRE